MIPHSIHQIWIGPRPAPTDLMSTWHANHPDWDYREWGVEDLDSLPWGPHRDIYDQYVNLKCWHGAADVARVEILRSLGGVYVDSDMISMTPLDGAPFLNATCFITESPHVRGRPQNAAMGSVPGSAVMRRYAERIASIPDLRPPWQAVGSGLLKKVIDRSVVMVPAPAFHPLKANGKRASRWWDYAGPIYGKHLFHSTNGK